MTSYTLENCFESNRKYPSTFHIPSENERAELVVGDFVKLIFIPPTMVGGERMWVKVTQINEDSYQGTLANDPALITSLKYEDIVHFEAQHIATILKKPKMC